MLNSFVLLFIAVIVLKVLWDITLDLINMRYSTSPNAKIPDVLKDKISEEDFEKAKRYLKDRVTLGVIMKITSLILTLVYVFFLFPFLEKVLESKGSFIVQSLLFFGIYALIDYLVELPFRVYSIFVVEQKIRLQYNNSKIVCKRPNNWNHTWCYHRCAHNFHYDVAFEQV